MEVRASVTGVRVSPRKARLVVDAVRGKRVMDAIALTGFLPQKTAKDVNKLLVSVAANAENNFSLDPEKLVVSEVYIDQGPMLKRWIPRSRGRATSVFKYSSHITLAVRQRQEGN